ncbi:translation initiation factor IF-3 [TM7 phylum sp. oral taxon 346]|uniref:translation initiation factor IF-3 n=1 Tax=Candidatus Nanosynsacchari sp. TM7_ANC_38.39_G1_1 TaxID=1986206 RepID=UPI000F211CA9|nr:MAG: translation initiation factor IF-3 [Candidatus Saccharimonas sp.]TWP27130.1 translation initiation factor IF-3 [TM7 phylum sp. oral taxon 346]
MNNSTRINNAIRSNELRVIGADGKQLGVMSLREALDIAQKAGVDLVEISPKANPPVAKIVDWGKYQYQKMKEQQKARRNNKANELKQMRFGLKIGSNDLEIKLRKIRAFLSDGHKVKILIFFRGREIAHKNLGYDLIDKMMEQLKDEATLEQKPTMAGRNLSIVIRSK